MTCYAITRPDHAERQDYWWTGVNWSTRFDQAEFWSERPDAERAAAEHGGVVLEIRD